MVPQPVLAVMLLFPIKPSVREAEAAERDRIEAAGQTVDESVWFTKQTIGNACGTIGLLHSIANCADRDDIELTGWFQSFLESAANLTPDERAALLEENDDLDEAHTETANEGQSTVNEEISQNIDTHFIAFVHRAGSLYQLDGRKPWPVNHGPSSPETLLGDACRVIKSDFMERDPGEMRFAITALAGRMD